MDPQLNVFRQTPARALDFLLPFRRDQRMPFRAIRNHSTTIPQPCHQTPARARTCRHQHRGCDHYMIMKLTNPKHSSGELSKLHG